ncbi:hypothetical protein [Streptomyces europaeiscabiei]|uniref:hypothetical protein n=1 Tax=Streptomyces europaeiscabiei TaxID=146819 RepID=UPI0038F716EC
MPTSTKVGSVSRARYEEIIAEDRKLVEVDTEIQLKIGDHALEIEPMRPHGGSLPAAGEELLGVRETLESYAEDIGVPYNQGPPQPADGQQVCYLHYARSSPLINYRRPCVTNVAAEYT